MRFGLPPTAPQPQLSGVRPHLTPNSAVQQPQGFAQTVGPVFKIAKRALTQVPTPMQALGALSLQDSGIDGFEHLAMTGGSSSDKKPKKTQKRTEAGKKRHRDGVDQRNAEWRELRKKLNLPYYKDSVKKIRWKLTELRQMASQQGSSSNQPPASTSQGGYNDYLYNSLAGNPPSSSSGKNKQGLPKLPWEK